MKIKIVILCMIFSSSAFAPVLATQSNEQQIESVVWSVMQDKALVDVYMSILFHESRYDNSAINYNIDGTHDFGVAQLNSRYWDKAKKYYDADISTLQGNVYAGAKFFLALYEMFPDMHSAVLAYNCGPGAVKSGNIPKCSRMYAAKVMLTSCFRKV